MRGAAVLGACIALLSASGCLGDPGPPGPAGAPRCADGTAASSQEVVVGDMTGGGRLEGTAHQAFPHPLADAVDDWLCVRALRVDLTWTNTATRGADLYVGVEVPDQGWRAIGQDTQQLALDGEHTESVEAAVGFGARDPAGLADGLVVLVLTDWASLSDAGLPARIDVWLHTAP